MVFRLPSQLHRQLDVIILCGDGAEYYAALQAELSLLPIHLVNGNLLSCISSVGNREEALSRSSLLLSYDEMRSISRRAQSEFNLHIVSYVLPRLSESALNFTQ